MNKMAAATYYAIRIAVPGDLNTLSLQQHPFPELKEREVLVHMEFSTINPSDINQLSGRYPAGPPPLLLGMEGSGTVVKSGGGEVADSLVGKRVAVNGSGTWGEYLVSNAYTTYPLLYHVTFEQAANLIINPMTVALFVEKIQECHKSVVQNAAASTLGKMLVKWCKILNIPLVNLVRRQEQVDILKSIGAEYVINTSEEGWKQHAKELCSSLDVTIGFDCIAGIATNDMADIINDGGVVYNYGRLSGQNCAFGSLNTIFQRKRLEGLWLTPWIMNKTLAQRLDFSNMIQSLIKEVFEVDHGTVINLNQVKVAVSDYSGLSTTNNKFLIRTRLD